MRKLLLPSLVLLGCWTATKPASTPGKPLETASTGTGGAAYGGEAYGGETYARVEAARNAGILGSTIPQQGGAFASLTGTGDISSGFDDADIYGGLIGDGTGAGSAGAGSGAAGGGGTGWGTIGTGRYGTIGNGTGTSTNYNPRGLGHGTGGMRGRTADVPTVSIGQPTASGGDLDKAIIRRYIKRNQQRIQYCYEKELLAKPSLAGTATVRFMIGIDGLVSKASGAGLPPVDACVAKVIAAIEFPKPKGGGPVAVSYPFVFRNGDTAKTP